MGRGNRNSLKWTIRSELICIEIPVALMAPILTLLALILMPVKHQENIRKASGKHQETSESHRKAIGETSGKIQDNFGKDSR